LVENLPEKGELTELWNEYNAKKTLASAIVKFADALDAWLQGLVTPSTWWPAWEDYNRKSEKSLGEVEVGDKLSKLFRRICDIAKDPDVQIRLSPPTDIPLDDTSLWNLLKFIKNIYCLKELPRHGFTIFGMKRSETDSFAGHSFTTACLSYLLSLTGDVSYDLQEFARKEWLDFEKSAIDELAKGLSSSRDEIKNLMQEWNELGSTEAWVVQVAAALDAWEMGITTPTAWMDAWLDYRQRNIDKLEGAPNDIRNILEEGYQKLACFEECKLKGITVGREPKIQLIRLE
jgi:5'-deoxynucleotidase YfbR-like HD superfamily hydrolase